MKKNNAATSISINLWYSSFTLETMITHKLMIKIADKIRLSIGFPIHIPTIKAIISSTMATKPKALTILHRCFILMPPLKCLILKARVFTHL